MTIQLYKAVRRPDTVNIFNGSELLATLEVDIPLGFNPLSPQWGRVESSNIPEGSNAVKYTFNGLPYVAEVNVVYSGRGDMCSIIGEVNAAATLYEYNSLGTLRAMIDRTSVPTARLNDNPPAAVQLTNSSILNEYSEGWWDTEPSRLRELYVMFECASVYTPPANITVEDTVVRSSGTLTPYTSTYITTLRGYNDIIDSILDSVTVFDSAKYSFIDSLLRGVWFLPYFTTDNLYSDYSQGTVDFRYEALDEFKIPFIGVAGKDFPANLNALSSAVTTQAILIDTSTTVYRVTGGDSALTKAIPIYRNVYHTFTADPGYYNIMSSTVTLQLGDSWSVNVPFSAFKTTPPWYRDNTASRQYTLGMQLLYNFNLHKLVIVPLFSWGNTDSPAPHYDLTQSFELPYLDRNIFEGLEGYATRGLTDLGNIMKFASKALQSMQSDSVLEGAIDIGGALVEVSKSLYNNRAVNIVSAPKAVGDGLDYVLGNPNLRILVTSPSYASYADSVSGELVGYNSATCIEGGMRELPYGYYKLYRASLSNPGGYPISLIRQAEKQLENGFWYQY